MKKIDNSQLMQMSIFDLTAQQGWSRKLSDDMVVFVKGYPKFEDGDFKGLSSAACTRMEREAYDALKKNTTLLQFVKRLEWERYKYFNTINNFNCKYRSFLQALIKLGLTSLDSVVLPSKTVSLELLKRVPKEKLLEMDARVLGTIGTIALSSYKKERWHSEPEDEMNDPYPTVAQLLEKGPYECLPRKAVNQTAQLLRQLGLSKEGKLFLEKETSSKAKLVRDLVASEKVSEEIATLIADIAARRGWV